MAVTPSPPEPSCREVAYTRGTPSGKKKYANSTISTSVFTSRHPMVAVTLRRVLQFDRHSSARAGIECINDLPLFFAGVIRRKIRSVPFAQALRKQPWESPCQPVKLEAGDLRNIPPHSGMNRKATSAARRKISLHLTVRIMDARDHCKRMHEGNCALIAQLEATP